LEDIELLKEHMLHERSARLRITAASAQRQMAWRCEEWKPAVLESLKAGFEHETDDEVLGWIIAILGTIAVRNLGMRENKDDPDVLHGDLDQARKKAGAFLRSICCRPAVRGDSGARSARILAVVDGNHPQRKASRAEGDP
jgi:hypothetical protein